MSPRNTVHNTMRIYHRYLGFFLAGIMAVYALSGITLIFRDTNFLKRTHTTTKKLEPNLSAEQVGREIRNRELKFDTAAAAVTVRTFKNGRYNTQTGEVVFTRKELPWLVEKLNHLHKAGTKHPLFYLNVFFGVSLLFFVISAFWMFMPRTRIFNKGLLFTVAGIVLTVILLLW